MTQQDARRRARRLREPSSAAPRQPAGERRAAPQIRLEYCDPAAKLPEQIAQFSSLKERIWWLWCHLVWAWQQLEHWLASRRQGAPVAIVSGIIRSVQVDNAAFNAYEAMGWTVASDARNAHDYTDDISRETYYRVTPVVITLTDDRVIHFCEYQVTGRSVSSNAPYFAGLNGMRVLAAGWWDNDVFSAWGLRLSGRREPQTVYVAKRPRNLPEPLEAVLSNRRPGFSEAIGLLGYSSVLMVVVMLILAGGEFGFAEAISITGIMVGLFSLAPVVLLVISQTLMRLMAGPLRPIPEMMAAGEYGERHLRLRNFDFGRCERDVFNALERQKQA
ncbi:hypothetical protein PQH03_23665 [Ralstonia insidiosa]|nr:hypothetical protein [Ralstonia insidiosa]MBX3774989.1 hypothetical protein [Ralstonia pickettii]NPA03110.1 hypothetical protein [Betaproteobacteria bacterium]MBA9915785.1 hypothetical protein [Ralstonia insidiosa]MBC9965243.1 hypothetical protein [Ralstonia insidiosa]MBX3813829.1 hypothetical protein [Ralstonia pickettii]